MENEKIFEDIDECVNQNNIEEKYLGALKQKINSCYLDNIKNYKFAFPTIKEEDFVYCLIEEMELIVDIFKNEGKDQCKVYFYRSTYSQTKKRFKFVKFREATTDKQKIYESQKELILKMVLKQRPNLFKSFHDIIETKEPASSLLFTHIPYDLLSYKNFTSLHLLESHTGNVKKKDLWHTKFLKQNNDLSFIPFTRKMLFIFGDKELIKPIDEAKHNIRETIIEIAKKCKWTPLTLETHLNNIVGDGIRSFSKPYECVTDLKFSTTDMHE
jgi:hypothetical protein